MSPPATSANMPAAAPPNPSGPQAAQFEALKSSLLDQHQTLLAQYKRFEALAALGLPERFAEREQFLENITNNHADYELTNMCPRTDNPIPHEDVGKFRLLERYLRLGIADKKQWPVPELPFEWIAYDSDMLQGSCLRVSARIAWLQSRMVSGEELYPEEGRYETLIEGMTDALRPPFSEAHMENLRAKLPDSQKWLLGFSVQPTLEWQEFLVLAGEMTIWTVTFPGKMPEFDDWGLEDGTEDAMKLED
ncbi:hypothetical protein K458DRAFT_403471 [Lentithecium fluviatile CBS 122367]|uniref:Uncharacterized protein n=1 Tax=Lentithecium fluviatile CBS 122367 TaxID=1168545 RepID=A0A6G1J4V5_9PLEO|nr:hypothetical protein K458DRAFT_403471 [Lentithecium fluviatile CBS 122367]